MKHLVYFIAVALPFSPSLLLAAAPADDHKVEVSSDSDVSGDKPVGHEPDGHTEKEALSNPLGIDPDLAGWTGIVFLVLMAVLWKFAWGPISEGLEKREKAVAENISEAQRQNEEARKLLSEHEAKLAGAASEVRQMLDDAKRDAESQKDKILADAQAAASSEKDRALREIDAAKNAVLQELAEKSVDTAVGLAGKIVRRQLSSEDHSELIDDALQKFPNSN